MIDKRRLSTSTCQVVRIRRERGVIKLAIAFQDQAVIESVMIPMREKEPGKKRYTCCLSTQVGCRMGCKFCATAKMGFVRNLTPAEIAVQAELAAQIVPKPEALVFMGMGEPLDNFDAWREAVTILSRSQRRGSEPVLAFSRQNMTVSTCGHVDGIARLAETGWRRMILAVSLNAPNDNLRSALMPVNKRWPMAVLRDALREYPMRNNIFLAEYVLFRGLNDKKEHAQELAEYLRPFRALVNLIGFNPAKILEGAGLFPPTAAEVERFRRWLDEAGCFARRRESKGRRIEAACGQLAAQLERKEVLETK